MAGTGEAVLQHSTANLMALVLQPERRLLSPIKLIADPEKQKALENQGLMCIRGGEGGIRTRGGD